MRKETLVRKLAGKFGLTIVKPDALTLRRERAGDCFAFRDAQGRLIHDEDEIARLKSLAVPPAYEDVRYAPDPSAHLQAIGVDAAGRLQYRYHTDWARVREELKARRLDALTRALPTIRRTVRRRLTGTEPTRDLAIAAVVELVALTAMRAGGDGYAKESGARGATTLLKSNVRVNGDQVTLRFKAKGGKRVVKEICRPAFAAAVARLMTLPGRRLFQYRNGDGQGNGQSNGQGNGQGGGTVHAVRAGDVNAFLRDLAGRPISLKDFRTLVASSGALETLALAIPAASARARKAQVVSALSSVAETLANTPAVCRKSYVHAAVVTAFEDGSLARYADELRGTRSPEGRAKILARIVARHID
jgi:DNA topoisomerase-1